MSKTFEVQLGPIMAAGPHGVDLIAPEKDFIVKADSCVISGAHFILKDRNGLAVFTALYEDVRYCRLVESAKGFKSDAVVSIVSANSAANEEGK